MSKCSLIEKAIDLHLFLNKSDIAHLKNTLFHVTTPWSATNVTNIDAVVASVRWSNFRSSNPKIVQDIRQHVTIIGQYPVCQYEFSPPIPKPLFYIGLHPQKGYYFGLYYHKVGSIKPQVSVYMSDHFIDSFSLIELYHQWSDLHFFQEAICLGHFLNFVVMQYLRYNIAITKIQRACENWLFKPICDDGTIGIVPRLSLQCISNF